MKKTAVIYDKWLHSLGGGEVVACFMAYYLKQAGYDVTLIGGIKIPAYHIKKTLGVDVSDIPIEEVWNDEAKLKRMVTGKDLFINMSFMDYSYGYAKKNIYYTHFPTELYKTVGGFISNNYILPFASKIIKPVEFITQPLATVVKHGHYGYILGNETRVAFSFLSAKQTYLLKFALFIENFKKSNLEHISYTIENASEIKKNIHVDYDHNIMTFEVTVHPQSNTCYLNIENANESAETIYLFNPKILPLRVPNFIYRLFFERINTRLRAGLFINIKERLKTYKLLVTHSEFVNKSIMRYWERNAVVLYPPVEMLYRKYNLSTVKKNNWICSVGRFFTTGHGKRQEIMIEAFKKMYDKGRTDWQLHLVGGVGKEPTSLQFIEKLQKTATGYPIFFHFNVPRKQVEEILLTSRIYWHATGFHEDEAKRPVKFEHFGIAPVEAMSAGCIPILYDGGGLREIIVLLKLPKQTHLFHSVDELVKNTTHIIETKQTFTNKKSLSQLNDLFSRDAFQKKFIRLVQNL